MKTFQYGSVSTARLNTCHPVLQKIADEALIVSPYDISIIHGWRNMREQNELYAAGASKKEFPDSRHNITSDPNVIVKERMSDAVDFAPYINGGIDWNDTHIFGVVAGVFMSVAKGMGYTLRWGGDWDCDGSTKDQSFMDWGHLEILWREA